MPPRQQDLASDTNVAARKRALRAAVRAARDATPADVRAAADAAIAKRVERLDVWHTADAVFTYLAFGSEVATRPLIEHAFDQGVCVVAPRVVSEEHTLAWYRICDFSGLIPSSFGAFEPDPVRCEQLEPARATRPVALVPGLVYDHAGWRLGYGGGYYDRFLAAFPGSSVGLVREAQLVESLGALGAVSSHDMPVDHIVTELRKL